jgi:hypothetical protein
LTQESRLHEQIKFFEMSDFDAKFMQDEELRSLLRQWSVPDAPGSLDQRVAATYQQFMSGPTPVSNSALHPQGDSEVVKMKFCDTCQEQFADRFSFCPVDGTPLSVIPVVTAAPTSNVAPVDIETSYPMSETAEPEKPVIIPPAPIVPPVVTPAPIVPPVVNAAPSPVLNTVAATSSAAAASHDMIGEYHLTILEDRGLVPRLAEELGNVAHNYQLTWPEFKRDPPPRQQLQECTQPRQVFLEVRRQLKQHRPQLPCPRQRLQ